MKLEMKREAHQKLNCFANEMVGEAKLVYEDGSFGTVWYTDNENGSEWDFGMGGNALE